MALLDLYSRRKRHAAKTGADVYQYVDFSPKLRNQMVQIISEHDVHLKNDYAEELIYSDLVTLLRKEIGLLALNNKHRVKDEFQVWFLQETDVDHLLDALEIASRLLDHHYDYKNDDGLQDFEEEVNARMLEAGFGFQLNSGQVIQIDSQFLHAEVVVPALELLSHPDFSTANEEFRKAHQEFREGNHEDCIRDCCNAFESTLKIILSNKGWPFKSTDTASKLLAVAFDNDLIPAYMQTEFAGLRTILESGVPTVRNKAGGHGAGVTPRNIPSHIASFQLHQTAAALVLLVEAAK